MIGENSQSKRAHYTSFEEETEYKGNYEEKRDHNIYKSPPWNITTEGHHEKKGSLKFEIFLRDENIPLTVLRLRFIRHKIKRDVEKTGKREYSFATKWNKMYGFRWN